MKKRHSVLASLAALAVITYLDRLCISIAGPTMQRELGFSPAQWGWIVGIFAISYGGLEIPGGALGDRWGQRIVIARIVVWWSAFTALTGTVSGFYALLAVRFLFGAGEAGAFPNISGAIARWFPSTERARAQGRGVGGEPAGRDFRAAGGGAGDGGFRVAGDVLDVRRAGRGVGGLLVPVVPQLAGGASRG